jgi:Effector-associated domain 11
MKQYLLNLIAEGKLGEAIAEMRQLANTQNKDFQTMLIQLSGQYAGNERDNAENTIELSDYKRAKARLSKSLIYLLDTEFEESKVAYSPPNPVKKEHNDPPTHKEKILKWIDEDIDAAFEELDKTILFKHAVYRDLSNEYISPPLHFSLPTFRGKLKRFVILNLH